MSFLLDTDTCSFHLKQPSGLKALAEKVGGLDNPIAVASAMK